MEAGTPIEALMFIAFNFMNAAFWGKNSSWDPIHEPQTGRRPQQWLSHSSHLTPRECDVSWAAIVAPLTPESNGHRCCKAVYSHFALHHILSLFYQQVCGSLICLWSSCSPHSNNNLPWWSLSDQLHWSGLINACHVFRPHKNQRSKWHWGEIEWGGTTTEECDQHAVQGQPFS